jgi:Transposase domain (DUF772)
MMGRQTVDQSQLFYLFNLEKRIPERHLLRRLNPIAGRILAEFREKLAPFYSEIGRPSIDPELMIRMLIIGYCYGIRFERRLCEEVALHLAYGTRAIQSLVADQSLGWTTDAVSNPDMGNRCHVFQYYGSSRPKGDRERRRAY